MTSPTNYTIIVRLFTELDNILGNYVHHSYSALASYLTKPLALAMVVYIALLGWSITQGWVQLSMGNLVKAASKLAAILGVALHWDIFSFYIINLIETVGSEISLLLTTAVPISLPHIAGEGINGALQSVFIEFMEISNWIWDTGSWHNIGPYVTSLLIMGFGYVFILVAILELVLAKLMLAILLGTAPLFICFTLFKPIHGLFDRWLGACVGFSLLSIFVSSMLALMLSLAQWVVADLYLSHATGIQFMSFVPMMVVAFIGIGVILKAANLAQVLGGAVTTSSGSSLLAGTVGGALGHTLSALRLTKSTASTAAAVAGGVSGIPKRAGFATMQAIRNSLQRGGN